MAGEVVARFPTANPLTLDALAAAVAEALLSRLDSGVLWLTLNRPEKKNALDLELLGRLAGELERARDDAAIRVVVIGAAGDVFCGGGDIQVMREFAGDAQATLDRLRGGLNRVVTLLHDLPKPVVAAVQGNAYGAGAILAFQCDLAVCADEAAFALSFRHVGLIPDTGGTWLLPRIVGLQKAKHLAWTGAPFTAKQAVEWGLALRAVPKNTVQTETAAIVQTLAEGPAATIGLAKLAFHLNLGTPLPEALDREARLQAQAFLTREHAEGRNAFFERRKPDFRKE